MKKGIVALLIVLAVIVLVSPGIVGRLAEQSMGDNLNWAAEEAQEVVVTSEGFERGWFSSAGQHRVEIRDSEMREAILSLIDSDDPSSLPELVIDTQLDHGLIPVTSMSREHGSLQPGLGSAVSTLRLEYGDGDSIDVPGSIYSKVGLTGELHANYILEPGSFSKDDLTTEWGPIDVLLSSNPKNGDVKIQGTVASLWSNSESGEGRIDSIAIDAMQHPTSFGIPVGFVNFSAQSITIEGLGTDKGFGPLSSETSASLDGDRINGRSQVNFENLPFGGPIGNFGIAADIRLVRADAAAVGKIRQAFNKRDLGYDDDAAFATLQPDALQLLAAGVELHIDQLDMSLAEGDIVSKLSFVVPESDSDDYTWTSALLALVASADVSVPAHLIDTIAEIEPQIRTVVGLGFLKKNGDVYEMEAEYKKGLLTINGAPMPIPLPGMQ